MRNDYYRKRPHIILTNLYDYDKSICWITSFHVSKLITFVSMTVMESFIKKTILLFSFALFMISVWQMVRCSKKNHSWNPDIKMQELSATIHILFDWWKNSYNSCWFHTETPTSHNSVHHVISGSSKSLSMCTGLLVLEIFIWTGSDMDAKVFQVWLVIAVCTDSLWTGSLEETLPWVCERITVHET